MFVAPYQVVLLLIAILGLAWGVIVFLLKRMDNIKEGIFNHIGEMTKQLTKVEKFCSRIDERTEDHDKRISRIENRMNRK